MRRFVAGRSSARALSCNCLSRRPEKARVTADICDHSEELADMWHGTLHGPDTMDFSRTSKQDHVRACARMCAYALGTWQPSSETAKIRKKENMKVRKDGKILIWVSELICFRGGHPVLQGYCRHSRRTLGWIRVFRGKLSPSLSAYIYLPRLEGLEFCVLFFGCYSSPCRNR